MEKLEKDKIIVSFTTNEVGLEYTKYHLEDTLSGTGGNLDIPERPSANNYFYTHEIDKLKNMNLNPEDFKINKIIYGMCDRINSTKSAGYYDGYELHLEKNK